VFPINDFGVQQGLKKLFGDKTVDQPFIDEITHKFNNYLTLLTFCL
jgi:3-methyladenine DNA glycosylase/8-oxoguanine DNA glycosylase